MTQFFSPFLFFNLKLINEECPKNIPYIFSIQPTILMWIVFLLKA
jgi:hypothetical protein